MFELRHGFMNRTIRCGHNVRIGVGGSGREACRSGHRAEELFFGRPCPHSGLVEIDLCGETGRGLEPPVAPAIAGCYHRLIFPGTDCAAVVREHGANEKHPLWDRVDPEQVVDVTDTSKLGGYAAPQVSSLVQELYESSLMEFLRDVAKGIERRRRTPASGWETVGPLHVQIFAGQNGSVGSTALHIADRLQPLLQPPYRITVCWLMLADRGRVTDRRVAMALQHAALTETHHRARAKYE
jgi:hypothetical protein